MRKRNKKTLLVGCVAFGLFLTASSILISHAQKKTETQKAENQVQDAQLSEARTAVAKYVQNKNPMGNPSKYSEPKSRAENVVKILTQIVYQSIQAAKLTPSR